MINLQRFRLGQFEEWPAGEFLAWKTRLYDGTKRICDVLHPGTGEPLVFSDVRIDHAEFIGTIGQLGAHLEDETGFEPDIAMAYVFASTPAGGNLAEGLQHHFAFYGDELEAERDALNQEGDSLQ